MPQENRKNGLNLDDPKLKKLFSKEEQVSEELEDTLVTDTETVSDDLVKIEAVKPQKSKLSLFLKLLIIFFFLSIAALAGFVGYSVYKSTEEKDTISLSDVEPEVAEDLMQQLVYQTGTGAKEYYSPTLDILLTYPEDTFSMIEAYDSVNISPTDEFEMDLFMYLRVHEKTDEDPPTIFTNQYAELYEDAEVIDSTQGDDGLWQIKITHSQPTLQEGEKEEVVHTILVKEVEGSFVSIDIKEIGGDTTTQKYIDDCKQIINSVILQPENIEEEIKYIIDQANVAITFDRMKWTVSSESERSLSLSFRSTEFEEEELKSANSYFNISTWDISSEVDTAYLEKLIADDQSYNEEFYKDQGYAVIEQTAETEVDGVMFVYYSYERIRYEDKAWVYTFYVGYNESEEMIMQIRTQQPKGESAGAKEIEKVISNITINETDATDEADEKVSTNVLGAQTVEIQKASIIGKPAVVHIANKTCTDVSVAKVDGFPNFSGKSYQVCTAGFGSGFYVNKDGYIVTNAHVASQNLIDVLIVGVLKGYDPDGLGDNLVEDILSYYAETNPDLYDSINANWGTTEVNEFMVEAMLNLLVIGLEDESITVVQGDTTNFVQVDEPFVFDQYSYSVENEHKHLTAETIEAYEIESSLLVSEEEGAGITIPDLALLKVDVENQQPSIQLADYETISVGQPVYVIGFPGAAGNDALFSQSADLVPTITNGTTSAIKPSTDNSFNLIQVDASISGGNSGGPMLNAEGQLIGVATYGIAPEEKAADYNAGVSVEEVQKLLSDNQVENDIGEVSDLIISGVDNFVNEYYSQAVNDFTQARNIDETLAELLNPLIKIGEQKISAGEDKTPTLTIGSLSFTQDEATMIYIIAGCIVGALVLIIFIAIISKILRSKPSQPQQSQQMPVQQPTQLPQQPQQMAVRQGNMQQQQVPQTQKPQQPVTQVQQTQQQQEPDIRPAQPQPVQQQTPTAQAGTDEAPVQLTQEPTVPSNTAPAGVGQPPKDEQIGEISQPQQQQQPTQPQADQGQTPQQPQTPGVQPSDQQPETDPSMPHGFTPGV